MILTRLIKRLSAFALLLSQAAYAGDVDTPRALYMIDAGAVVIDVRSPQEFQSGHLEGALNIPLPQIVAGVNARGFAPNTEIVVYCRSGNRSRMAATSLREAGYSAVVNGGGLTDLQP